MPETVAPVSYKTCKRINEPGDSHYLTFSCYQRRPLLNCDRTRILFTAALKEACLKQDFALWAYVLMPEHVHLLVCPRQKDYSVSKFLYSVKRPVAVAEINYARRLGAESSVFKAMSSVSKVSESNLHFWQAGGGYDRNINTKNELWEKIDYIHANAVRRRLCEDPSDWIWSSASYYSGLAECVWELNLSELPERS